MKVLVNAVALKVAGARSVLNNFLDAVSEEPHGHTYFVFLPREPGYKRFRGVAHMRMVQVPGYLNKFYFRYFIDHLYLRLQIWRIRPQVIFSMGNVALPVRSVPQMLLFHTPYPIYPESVVWARLGRRKKFFQFQREEIARKFKYAGVIAAQTETARKRLGDLYGLASRTVVIPNAVSLPQGPAPAPVLSRFNKLRAIPAGAYKFLCLSRYYEHKNLEILVEVARRIKERGLDYSIIITIDSKQGKGAARILRSIREEDLGAALANIGSVSMTDVPALYSNVDAMLLPTLLESFSGTYVEAAFYHKPVFTSAYDFALEVLGENAIYFDPLDPDDIIRHMGRIKDSSFIGKIVNEAGERVRRLPSWRKVSSMYVSTLEQMVDRGEGPI